MVQETKMIEFTEKEFQTVSEILFFYKEFQENLYDYPEPETLFTATMLKLFDIFEVYV